VAELPVAAGNHEFDDGVPALLAAAALLPYPLLCANADVGLPASAIVETGAGPLGVVGLTHPHVDRLTKAPAPAGDWPRRVGPLARELRSEGARWVVAILHDGVDWWPNLELVPDAGGRERRGRGAHLARGHALGRAPAGRAAGARAGRRARGRRGPGGPAPGPGTGSARAVGEGAEQARVVEDEAVGVDQQIGLEVAGGEPPAVGGQALVALS
jgi:hypothetical protein